MKIEEYTAISVADAGYRRVDLREMLYPKATKELKLLFDALFALTVASATSLRGGVTPYAGRIYLEKCACTKILKTLFGTFIMMSQSHADCMTATTDLIWKTQFNLILPDNQRDATLNTAGTSKHLDPLRMRKKSLETQVFFICYWISQKKAVPVLLDNQSLTTMETIENALSRTIDVINTDVVILATGGELHYATTAVTKQNDQRAIAPTTKLDVHAPCEELIEMKQSMCNHNCISTDIMFTSKQIDAREAKTIMYQTSGSVIGDCHKIISYVIMEVA
ncbi:MAG: AmmeMemoRadiSam system protein B [Methanocalculaceae archaeon]|jgi:AmmeMemoRadiSam system protein B|nr:AmmeMemoRadiSam system protein B [Methanocalculaceae archaeon]